MDDRHWPLPPVVLLAPHLPTVAKTKGPRRTPDWRLRGILGQLEEQAAPDALEQIAATRSQPFAPTPGEPVAVKIITTTGAEMTTVIPADELAAALDT